LTLPRAVSLLPWRIVPLVFLGGLLLFGAFNGLLPITDPVESTYALTAKEMIESGDLLSPRIHGRFWYDKPALFYWLLILSFRLFGFTDFAARLPSACAGAAALAFSSWFYHRLYGSVRGALLLPGLLAGSLMFWAMSRMVLTDAVLAASISVALGCLCLHLRDRSPVLLGVAWLMAGVGVLDKGPVAIVVPAIVVALYALLRRDPGVLRRSISPSGVLVFLAVVLPWYGFMLHAHGTDFVNGFLGLNNLVRATVSEHPGDDRFTYYLWMVPASLLPWTLVAARALWTERKEGGHLFAVAWILGFVLFFTAMATKYPTYCLPAVFPALLLAARRIDRVYDDLPRLDAFLVGAPSVLLATALALAGLVFSPGRGRTSALLVAALLAGFLVVVRTGSARVALASIALATGSLTAVARVAPAYMHQRSAKGAAEQLPKGPAAVACAEEFATSAAYYSGQRMVELGVPDTGPWAGKYVMPHEPPESFFARTREVDAWVLASTPSGGRNFRSGPHGREFRPVFDDGIHSLFLRRAAPDGGAAEAVPR